MPDDKTKVKEDRKLVASGETYEVADFAKKYGLPPSEAETIISATGHRERNSTRGVAFCVEGWLCILETRSDALLHSVLGTWCGSGSASSI